MAALRALGLSSPGRAAGDKVLPEPTVAAVAEYIKEKKPHNVVVMCGAGISTAAGIPDFRTPGTGLYSNLAEYNLPTPEAVFEISYFRHNPLPFYHLSHHLTPGRHLPTMTHYFLALLEEKGVLRRIYTQNIDTLETLAGVPREKIVEAHGSYGAAHCVGGFVDPAVETFLGEGGRLNTTYWSTDPRTARRGCGAAYDTALFARKVREGKVPLCERCGGLVKPDIVFFGEGLPRRFFDLVEVDFDPDSCDLVIVMGTSLLVGPFNQLPYMAPPRVPRLMLNMTPAGGFDYSIHRPPFRDAFWKGPCDEGVVELARALGWEEDLKRMFEEGRAELRKQWAEAAAAGAEAAPTEGASAGGAAEPTEAGGPVESSPAATPQPEQANGADSTGTSSTSSPTGPSTEARFNVYKPHGTQIITSGGVVIEEVLEDEAELELSASDQAKVDEAVDAILLAGLKLK
ncbi:DHS-like NAD/FAD-binding domain-containing protein [Hyaloraphidium curvatum]|nr:DHS-like NAD/FAD-binding domain-containing protein [Hyaloraphidium curvatum]